MSTTIENCQLEIDHERGVIYAHSGTTGWTILRISKLPAPIPPHDRHSPMLDINYNPPHTSWHGEIPDTQERNAPDYTDAHIVGNLKSKLLDNPGKHIFAPALNHAHIEVLWERIKTVIPQSEWPRIRLVSPGDVLIGSNT